MAAQHMTYYKHGSITYDLLKEWQHNISCPTLYMAAQHRPIISMAAQHMTYYKHGSTTYDLL